ncbi:MAG TPA: helix-turn-helix domain-containing protein [Chitinophagaceae bacterium]
MGIIEIQQQIFSAIKNRLSPEASVAEETARILDISTDSAYRRMRGEKQISLEELYKLCTHYNISLDQLMEIQTGAFMFQGNILDNKTFQFDKYLTGIMNSLAYMNSFKEKEFFNLCKDSPIFHHFYFREFAAFKYFAWMGTLMHLPEFKNKKVNFEEYPDSFFEIGQKALALYDKLDSVEIWNIESLNTTLRQIDFFRDGNRFRSDQDILKVYEAIEKMMDHLEKQAELGYKFNYGDPEKKPLGRYRMYFNEVVLGDNSSMAVIDNSKIAFLPHTAMNYLMTRDMKYCDNYHSYIQNLMKSSTLISEVSEKERSKFFRIHRDRIASRKASLKI